MRTLPTLTPRDMYLLDTDVCSYLMKNRFGLLGERLRSVPPELVTASAITVAETWFGLEWGQVGLRRRLVVREFYASLRVLPWPPEAAPIYGDLRARLRRANLNIGSNDLMIAAHAIALDATLVTNNTRHFSRTGPPLKLENWLEPHP